MPCDCSHMEPNEFEEHRREAAQVMLFLLPKLNRPIPMGLEEASKHVYGEGYMPNRRRKPDAVITDLCDLLGEIGDEQISKIVTRNIKNPKAALLLKWWADHQEEDRIRREKEAAKIARQKAKERKIDEARRHQTAVAAARAAYGVRA